MFLKPWQKQSKKDGLLFLFAPLPVFVLVECVGFEDCCVTAVGGTWSGTVAGGFLESSQSSLQCGIELSLFAITGLFVLSPSSLFPALQET